jgi:nucleoside-diphosphate-sugar epimerase
MQRGLRATILRPGLTIAPEARHADGVLAALVALAKRVKALPALDMPVDLVSADYVAGAIAAIAAEPRNIGGTFHLTHPRPLSMKALAPLAASSFGFALQPYEAWRARVAAELPRIEDAPCAALAALVAAHDAASLTPAAIDCRQAARAIGGRVPCPPVMELLEGFLRVEAPA